MLAAAAGVAVALATGALPQASPPIRNGAYGWHGAVQRQRALKIAAGRRRFPQLSIVFLGQHQKPLSRERVGLISHRGPALQSSCRTRHP